jgi:hypothetical protein
VSNLPAVSKLALDVRYPAYTGLPAEHQDDGGDVAAVVGSTVTVRPSTAMPAQRRADVRQRDDGAAGRRPDRRTARLVPRRDERILSRRSREPGRRERGGWRAVRRGRTPRPSADCKDRAAGPRH